MRETRVEDVRRVYEGFFSVDEATVTYEKADGTWSKPSKRLSVERGDAAAVLIHDLEKDTLIFVRQYRYPTARHGEPWPLEIVAGSLDEGETPEEAARRESEEEVGIKPDRLEKIAEMYSSPGGLSEKISIFYAEGRHTGGGGGLEGEDVDLVEIPREEALAMVRRGEIRDGKSLVALLWLASGGGK
ncbi:NUDIX domain-containing protein [bacterium]|nr:MAG: NUDIX domain-containing protein [bacterium]